MSTKRTRKLQPITLPDRGKVSLDLIDIAARIVDTSGVLEQCEDWYAGDKQAKGPGGRPSHISVRAALILALLPVLMQLPMNLSVTADILTRRLDKKAWDAIGLRSEDFRRGTYKQWYHRYRNTLRRRVISCFDPYPETPMRERLKKEVYYAIKATRDPEFIKQRKMRGSVFGSLLAVASARLLGDDVFETYLGDVVLDATVIEILTYGTTKESKFMPSQPDAGWYRRGGDHNGDAPGVTVTEKRVFGLDATLVVATGGRFGEDIPAPIVGVALDKPGRRVGFNGRLALAVFQKSGVPRRYLVGDRIYSPGAAVDNYQRPTRLDGWGHIGDLPDRDEALGITADVEGVTQVAGQPYCPCIAAFEDLLHPKADHENKDMTDAEREAKHARRKVLQLPIKETRADGSQRFQCPALSGKVFCPLRAGNKQAREAAAKKTALGQPPIPLPQHVLDKVNTSGKICSQASVLVSIHEHDRFHKYAQQGPPAYTKEWEQLYRKARNLVEARNHSMKSMVAIGKGERTKRYMRGIGAFLFLIGLAVAGTNTLLAINYLRRQIDEGPGPRPPRGGRPRKGRAREDMLSIAGANAPPQIGEAA